MHKQLVQSKGLDAAQIADDFWRVTAADHHAADVVLLNFVSGLVGLVLGSSYLWVHAQSNFC